MLCKHIPQPFYKTGKLVKSKHFFNIKVIFRKENYVQPLPSMSYQDSFILPESIQYYPAEFKVRHNYKM